MSSGAASGTLARVSPDMEAVLDIDVLTFVRYLAPGDLHLHFKNPLYVSILMSSTGSCDARPPRASQKGGININMIAKHT